MICRISCSLCANPLARSPGQVQLDSDKWKLWKNFFNKYNFFLNLAFGQVKYRGRWKKLWQRLKFFYFAHFEKQCNLVTKLDGIHGRYSHCYNSWWKELHLFTTSRYSCLYKGIMFVERSYLFGCTIADIFPFL